MRHGDTSERQTGSAPVAPELSLRLCFWGASALHPPGLQALNQALPHAWPKEGGPRAFGGETCAPSSSALHHRMTLPLRHWFPRLVAGLDIPEACSASLGGGPPRWGSLAQPFMVKHYRSMSIPPCHSSGISSHKHCLLWFSSRAVASWEGPQVCLLTPT